MKKIMTGIAFLVLPMTLAGAPASAADFATFSLTTSVNAAPEKTWSRIGDFCAIKDWLGTTCSISTGSGDVGTMRLLNNGAVSEMMVAKTPFSYTYMQPLNPANLYHGTLQVQPDGAGHSKIVYTFIYDQEPLGSDDAKAAGRKQRSDRFNAALAKMKAMAEAP